MTRNCPEMYETYNSFNHSPEKTSSVYRIFSQELKYQCMDENTEQYFFSRNMISILYHFALDQAGGAPEVSQIWFPVLWQKERTCVKDVPRWYHAPEACPFDLWGNPPPPTPLF
jgi:hypothetical protein